MCDNWLENPYFDQDGNMTNFKEMFKHCKTTSISKSSCAFLDKTLINPQTGIKLSPTGSKFKSLKKKCNSITNFCLEWSTQRTSSNPKNPMTGRRINYNGKTFKKLEDMYKNCLVDYEIIFKESNHIIHPTSEKYKQSINGNNVMIVCNKEETFIPMSILVALKRIFKLKSVLDINSNQPDEPLDAILINCNTSQSRVDLSLGDNWTRLVNGGFILVGSNDYSILDKVSLMKNSKYLGMLRYGNDKWTLPIWIFYKLQGLTRTIYDKPVVLDSIRYEEKLFHVVREDMLIGGSKQRVAIPFLSELDSTNIFYRGPANGYAQVALAYSCLLLGKNFHMIVNKQKYEKYDVTFIAMIFGCKIHEVQKAYNGYQEKKQELEIKNIMKRYKNSLLLPLGLYNDNVINYYTNSMLKTLFNSKPKRMWITVSSCVILHALYKILPSCHFNVVMVGDRNMNLIDKKRTSVFFAPQNFRQAAPFDQQPPYPSERSYDAKLWQFVKKHGQDGDFIFNVAGLEVSVENSSKAY